MLPFSVAQKKFWRVEYTIITVASENTKMFITSPIYRTCSFNSRNYGVLCRCHSWQTPKLVSRVLSHPLLILFFSLCSSLVLPLSFVLRCFFQLVDSRCHVEDFSEVLRCSPHVSAHHMTFDTPSLPFPHSI